MCLVGLGSPARWQALHATDIGDDAGASQLSNAYRAAVPWNLTQPAGDSASWHPQTVRPNATGVARRASAPGATAVAAGWKPPPKVPGPDAPPLPAKLPQRRPTYHAPAPTTLAEARKVR